MTIDPEFRERFDKWFDEENLRQMDKKGETWGDTWACSHANAAQFLLAELERLQVTERGNPPTVRAATDFRSDVRELLQSLLVLVEERQK